MWKMTLHFHVNCDKLTIKQKVGDKVFIETIPDVWRVNQINIIE